jgi:hypothetical protein
MTLKNHIFVSDGAQMTGGDFVELGGLLKTGHATQPQSFGVRKTPA